MPSLRKLAKIINAKFYGFDIYLVAVLFVAFVLRFVYLGYSDYQGDEIKAFYFPAKGQNFIDFLFAQRKGPVQFILTFLIKLIEPNYMNAFVTRLPFAIVGFLSVYFFYLLIKSRFGQKIAFYSSFFFATLGFLIAFSRIVQYQSFTIFFMILTLYLYSKAGLDEKFKLWGLYLGSVTWALSILSHYDGIFIAPFACYLLLDWFSVHKLNNSKKNLLHMVFAGAIAFTITACFYVPFFLSVGKTTTSYWFGRVTGEISGKVSDSRYLFSVYQPIYVVHIYTILATLGLLYILYRAYVNKKDFWLYVGLLSWVFVPTLFMEGFVYVRGTHIYTYLVPLLVVVAYGLYALEEVFYLVFTKLFAVISQLSKIIAELGIIALFFFIISQAYAIYIENGTEYPWSNEKFLIWTMPRPNSSYHLSLFGFPYNRNWYGIKNFVVSHTQIVAHSTNERRSLARYFIPLPRSSEKAGAFIFIKNPQSFIDIIEEGKFKYWSDTRDPDYVFTRNGEDLAKVYLIPPVTWPELVEMDAKTNASK